MKNILRYFVLFLTVTIKAHALENETDVRKPEAEIGKTPDELAAKGGGEFMMHFKNFPTDESITMMCAHVIQRNPDEFQEVEKFIIAPDGKLWIKGTVVSFYTFGAEGIARGERVRYRYILADGTLLAESSFIPYPLVIQSKKKTFSIDIELLQLEPMVYSLTYCGLNNGERMRLRSCSGGEMEEEDFFYHTGKPSIYVPGVPGAAGGYALLDITRLAGDLLKVQVPWGTEVLRRVAGMLPEVPPLQIPVKKPRPHRSR